MSGKSAEFYGRFGKNQKRMNSTEYEKSLQLSELCSKTRDVSFVLG